MHDSRVIDALAATDLFSTLNKKSLRSVAALTHVLHHDAGRRVAQEGEPGLGFHLILDGRATVEVGGEPRGELTAGDYFGEVALIDGQARSATVTAQTDLTTVSIAAWLFRPLLHKDANLANALLVVVCARLRKAELRAAAHQMVGCEPPS